MRGVVGLILFIVILPAVLVIVALVGIFHAVSMIYAGTAWDNELRDSGSANIRL